MNKLIIKKRIILSVLFLVVCSGFFIISFNFRDTAQTQPQRGGWQLQTNLQTMLNGSMIKDIIFLDSLTGFAVNYVSNNSDTGCIFKTTNGGNNWTKSFINVDTYGKLFFKISFVTDSIGYACGGGGIATMCKTTNRGTNWTKTNYSWATAFRGMSILGKDSIYVTDDDPLVGGVFRSTDGGGNWQRIYNGAQYNPQYIYMINGMIGYYSQGYTYKTTDGGFSWAYLDNVGFTYMKFFDTLTGYRISSANIQKTDNGGMNWLTFTLPSIPDAYTSKYILNLFFVGRDTIWAAGGLLEYLNPYRNFGTLYKTTNGGINWGYQVPDTSIIHTPRYYFVNFKNIKHGWAYHSLGQGIHTTVGGDSTIIVGINQVSVNIPLDFSLEQNQPNPFNPKTKINYKISKKADIRITVYDMLGKEIRTIVYKKHNPGNYEVSFDGSSLSSGIYFYSLLINEKIIETKRMVLIK
ncbi:MAG: T9SS type A sorting domain-containing protein [Ignavibacteria bacterium]|nr:T9SS type A sorting domain-containing protein [Ignavibacteria bacterium]